MTLYLSRATLRPDASREMLGAVLAAGDLAGGAGHRLVWSLFADDPERKRDFLWRDAGNGTYFTLSPRPPVTHQRLFSVETRPVDFDLRPGDLLRFTLRVNPTVSAANREQRGIRGHRHDIVTAAMVQHRGVDRDALDIDGIAHAAARDWLARRGSEAGFSLTGDFVVEGRDWVRIHRRRQRPIEIGVMDLAGVLAIDEPATFMAALGSGFGRCKAFGCGMMMVRRAA